MFKDVNRGFKFASKVFNKFCLNGRHRSYPRIRWACFLVGILFIRIMRLTFWNI